MTNKGLEELVEEYEESTVEKIRKAVLNENIRFEGVYGIREVKENLMDALERASFVSRQGYTPIILMIGPSGSGKTELINSVMRAYKQYARSTGIFTLKINGKNCPYNENPLNLYRSILPEDVKLSKFSKDIRPSLMNKKRPEICRECENNLEQALEDEITLSIDIKRVYPQSSIVELGDSILLPSFVNMIKNSNRSILTISADKSRFEDIDPKVFQFMNNVYDNNLSDSNGSRIPLDSLIIIHSNEGFMELSDEEKKESMPLLERIIRVDVRRNLSYKEEMKIIDEYNIPIKHKVPDFTEYIAKINVLSRLSPEFLNNFNREELENRMELLDYYDSPRLDEFNVEMTPNMSDFLKKIIPEEKDKDGKEYFVDAAKTLIMEDTGEYKSGWNKGISSRAISNLIDFNYKEKGLKGNLLFSDIFAYINKNKDRISNDSYNTIKEYIDMEVSENVTSDVDYAILSFYFGDHFRDYTAAITDYFNSLLNPSKSKEFKDSEGYLSDASRYFDVEIMKDKVEDFRKKKVPYQIANYSADFQTILNFLVSNADEPIKKEDNFNAFFGEPGKNVDKTSRLYHYIKDFLTSNRGYFDEAVEEVFKIYKDGSVMYD